MADSQISDDEIIAGIRALRGEQASVRLRKRKRLRPTAGLTGSYFERVQLEVDGRPLKAILKCAAGLTYGPPTREALFFAELSRDVPMRVPEAYGVGTSHDGRDSWVLMEALPRSKRISEWAPDDTPRALRNLAALHARYLGAAPPSLPRPFTRDLDQYLDFVPGGISGMRAKYDELPAFPRAPATSLDLLARLVEERESLRAVFARSPETLVHGDYHRGNLVVRDGEPHAVFDWQFVCAGPPVRDLVVFWLYLGAVNVPGFLRFFDRTRVVPREMTWDQVFDVYAAELRRLRPDADVDAIRSAADGAIVWEIIRSATYFADAMDNLIGMLRFIYRDHRTVGGWFANWMGITSSWQMFDELWAEFDERATRILATGALAPGPSPSRGEG